MTRICLALLCLLMLGACAVSSYAPWRTAPWQATFSAWYVRSGTEIPLQGQCRFSEETGSLTLFLITSQMIGRCSWTKEQMHCTASSGSEALLRDMGNAVFMAACKEKGIPQQSGDWHSASPAPHQYTLNRPATDVQIELEFME